MICAIIKKNNWRELFPYPFTEGYRLTIFLTGTTGFLGGKLLTNLLQTTDHKLFVLVRDIEKAQNLVAQLPGDAESRIRLLSGDITKPNCGLSQT